MPECGLAERTMLGMTGFAFSTAAVLVAAYSPLLATLRPARPPCTGRPTGSCSCAWPPSISSWRAISRAATGSSAPGGRRRPSSPCSCCCLASCWRKRAGRFFAASFRAGASMVGVRRGKRVLLVRVDERAEHHRGRPHPQGQPLVVLPCRLHRRRRFGHAHADRHRGPSLPVRRLVRTVVAGTAAALSRRWTSTTSSGSRRTAGTARTVPTSCSWTA